MRYGVGDIFLPRIEIIFDELKCFFSSSFIRGMGEDNFLNPFVGVKLYICVYLSSPAVQCSGINDVYIYQR